MRMTKSVKTTRKQIDATNQSRSKTGLCWRDSAAINIITWSVDMTIENGVQTCSCASNTNKIQSASVESVAWRKPYGWWKFLKQQWLQFLQHPYGFCDNLPKISRHIFLTPPNTFTMLILVSRIGAILVTIFGRFASTNPIEKME